MFNQQPFNIGKFNARSSQSMSNSATALMSIKSDVLFVSKVISASGASDMKMRTDLITTVVKYSDGVSGLIIDSEASETLIFISDTEESNMNMNSDIIPTNILLSSGISSMKTDTDAEELLVFISDTEESNMNMNGDIVSTIVKYGDSITDLKLDKDMSETLEFVEGNTSDMKMESSSNQSLSGESTITLENINLMPNSELVINTCDMTVMLDGQNAMKYFSSDSEFFSLLNGINEIIYSDDGVSRDISLDVIWKDKWL